MADGYARAGGQVGVCLSTTGPAALNTLTPLGTAFSDSSRVLCIASQIQAEFLGREKGLLHECSGQSGGFQAVTKWRQTATTVDAIPWLVRDAFAQLGSGRPRPAALEIPCDVLDAAGRPALPAPLETDLEQPCPEELSRACQLLEKARRPVIWAGGGLIRAGASDALTRLAERLQSPVFTTTLGKGAIPEDHPLSAGNTLLHPAGRAYLQTCDLMLAVGTRFKEIETERWHLKLPERLIHMDIDPAEIGRNYEVSAAVVGHARPALEGCLELCRGAAPARDRAREVKELRGRIWSECRQRAPAAVELVECLRAALPRESVLVCDLTAAASWCHHLLEVYEPATFHSPWGFCTLGFGLPAAIGAKLAQPRRPVVLLSGDGGFLFNCQELATAVECGLPLVMMVFNDRGYGVLRPQQMARYGRTHAADLVNPDFADLAKAFGAGALRVERLEDLPRNLSKALCQPKPCLIEVTAPIPWPPIETTAGMFAQAEVSTQ